nr:hypothetical protein [Tanacetum cinerariifolium]
MPNEYQQDYKKTRSYAPKLYNDPNMFDSLRDIYRALESRYVHEGRTINPSFYNDLSDDSIPTFTTIDEEMTKVIEGVDQPIAPTTAKQRLARKNKLKACGTLLMDLLDKHQLKFNIHKDAKTLME